MSNNLLCECILRGKGKCDKEVDLRYGVKKNHMITLKSIELSFLTYIATLYIHLEVYHQIVIFPMI